VGATHESSSVLLRTLSVAALMATGPASFFDGLSTEEIQRALGTLQRRRFPAGSVVIAEGDLNRQLYVAEAGAAEVFVSDRLGVEHRVGWVNPGATMGEMSMLSGQPAAGTVRATSDLEVVVLTESDVERAAAAYPRIYRNIGAILSERLARMNRLSLRKAPGRVVVLDDAGAPPLLAYALACSVAWHTRRPTVLVAVGDTFSDHLAEIVTPLEPPVHRPDAVHDGAQVVIVNPTVAGSVERLAATVEDLFHAFDHVLVHARLTLPQLADARILRLAAANGPVAAEDEGESCTCLRAWTDTNGARPARGSVVGVPVLERDDIAQLRRGLLPSGTPAGAAVGLPARDLAGLKVGLALGAGSLRGYAHVGVLRAFERIGLMPDCLAGASVGAAVAAISALGSTADEVEEAIDEVGKTLFRIGVPIKGLVSNRGLKRALRIRGETTKFEDLPIPLAIVAADIDEMREVVFRRGLVWPAVLASCAIPGVYPALRIGPYTLVDGGVLSPVPTNAAADLGAGTVLAVRLGNVAAEPVTDAVGDVASGRPPSAVSVIVRSIELMQSRISTEPTVPTITIAPEFAPLPGAGLRRFTEGRQYVEDGEAAVEAALPRLTAAFPWLGPKVSQ
jgi:NTE family protein